MISSTVAASRPRASSSRLNSSISRAAIFLNAGSIASPDSSCAESMSSVFGRSIQRCPCPTRLRSTLREQRQVAGHDDGLRRRHGPLAAGDPVEHELADVRVLADDDEDRRRAGTGGLPGLVRALRSCRRGWRSASSSSAGACGRSSLRVSVARPALPAGPRGCSGHSSRNTGPVGRHRVVRDGHARDLHDARLDGVDEAEVRHDPREERRPPGSPSPSGRTAWPTGRRSPGCRAWPCTARRPLSQTRASSLARLTSARSSAVSFSAVGSACRRRRLVAVVRLVVEDDDVLLVAQDPADAAHHLVGRLLEAVGVALGRPGGFFVSRRCLERLAGDEGVEVGDQDVRLPGAAAAGRASRGRVRRSSCPGRWAAAPAAGRGS